VQCQLDHLRTLRTEFDIREALGCLPPGLPATYKAMLDRIGHVPRDLKYAKTAFMWLIHCPQPLRLTELAVAAVIDSECDFDEGMRLTTSDDILEICGSFVKIERKSVIRLAHFSVQEFFTSATLPDGSRNDYFLDKELANMQFLKACFSYLRSPQFCSIPSVDPYYLTLPTELLKDSFFFRAASYWPRLAHENPTNSQMSRDIFTFLKSSAFTAWASWYYVRTRDSRQWDQAPQGPYSPISNFEGGMVLRPGPLYVASDLSLPRVVKMMLDQGESPNQKGGRFVYPIFAAIRQNNAEVLAILLSAGANIAVKLGSIGWTPLHEAAEMNSLSQVKLLIEWDADVTAMTSRMETPLMLNLRSFPQYVRESDESDLTINGNCGLEEPHSEIVRSLLFNAVNHQSEVQALCIAIERGFSRTAKILLAEPERFPINYQGSRGNTLLHFAAAKGSVQMARLLLEVGADDMMQNKHGLRAVHLAAEIGNVQLMKLLGNMQSGVKRRLYALDGLDLSSLRLLENDHRKAKLLLRLASVYPKDHVWRHYLSLAIFKSGDHTTAAKLREQSLRLNPRNKYLSEFEDLVHSIACERCQGLIRGRYWICRLCYVQLCACCHTLTRTDQNCRSASRRDPFNASIGIENEFSLRSFGAACTSFHFFMGFPAYCYEDPIGKRIEDNHYEESYKLLAQPYRDLNYVYDRVGLSPERYTQD